MTNSTRNRKFVGMSSSPEGNPATTKRPQTRKKRFAVSSSSLRELKEKIENLQNEKKGEVKTDLKVSQDIRPMASVAHPLPTGRLNEKFIELMDKLSDIMLKQNETFRARAYQKAQETIMAFPGDILNPEQLHGQSGIGPAIMEKLNEYILKGTLDVIEREKKNPVNILADVYGIGPKKAAELVAKGITTIAQLRENVQLLNDVQKVGLVYYEDVLKRIPRSEIEQYKGVFESGFNTAAATPESRFEIVGSYRRGAQNSGDIDVIITSDDPRVFVNFVDELIKRKVILAVLSRGPTKCLVMAKIPCSDSVRRVDFLYTSLAEFPFAILYFTGSKIFNTVMRHQALQMGLTMNEHGLYKMDGKKKGDKIAHIFKNEKDIFDYLHMAYKTPIERADGRAVVINNQKSPQKKPFIIEDDVADEVEAVVADEDEGIVMDDNALAFINTFKTHGMSALQTLNENQLMAMLNQANILYRNSQPVMSDNQYDILQEFISKKYPANKDIYKIGALVGRNKATLPYFMGSMDKIKPDTHALPNWVAKYKGPYVLSCKLDGVSGLYTTEGDSPKLYTRGDGKVGQDISYLIPHLRLPKTKGVVIRGEFVIPKEVFVTKYKATFANPRNMVSGLVNHKTINAAISDVHFVAYEVIKPEKKTLDQMSFLSTLDVDTVLFKVEPSLTNELLSQTLVDWRQNYPYEIDGVIVTNDGKYNRNTGNPEHSFAFKMVLSDQIAEALVVDVIWTPSKDGYLKPRVQIDPINLGGVRIEYATGFNAAFIEDNKVGVGAMIELIRSGDVIPHIRKVTTPAEKAKMPTVAYKWNETHVDIMLENIESDETVREKNVTGFFKGIQVDRLGAGNIARIIQAGFDTVPKIIKMTVDDFLHVEGFKKTMAITIYNGIREKIDAASLITLMAASNIFGRGFSDKRIELIMDSYPMVLVSTEADSKKVGRIVDIKGMSTKTAEAFVDKIPAFITFIQEAGLGNKLIHEKKTVADNSHPLCGKSIVMTGFRDAGLQEKLANVGVKLGSGVSKNTFLVLVKDKEDETGKAADARKLGVTILTPDEFNAKYF